MIKVPLLRHQRYISPSPLTSQVKTYLEKNVDFDTFDGHVMVNYIEPNLQEIIFGPIRVGLITQKQFWDHLKNDIPGARPPTTTSQDGSRGLGDVSCEAMENIMVISDYSCRTSRNCIEIKPRGNEWMTSPINNPNNKNPQEECLFL